MAGSQLLPQRFGREHADVTIDPAAVRAALDPRQQARDARGAAVGAQQHG